MSASSRISQASIHLRRPGWSAVLVSGVVLSAAVLLLAPWTMEAKSIAVLHGLCAQRPSHSFWFGQDRLPFGSRMTGIYGAFLITQLYLLARRRIRAGGIPSLGVVTVLLLFVIVMGLDGLNSTLDDVHLVTVYQPMNLLRFITGAVTGTTLAVFLWLLASNILWRPELQVERKVVSGFLELAMLGLPIAGFGLLAMSGARWLYPFIAVVLVCSGVLVVFELALCLVLLVRREENQAARFGDLARAAVWSLLAAYLFMGSMAGLRFLMEATLNVRQLS